MLALGDVVEFDVDGRYAYAQYTHEEPSMGALLSVLAGTHRTPQQASGDLVAGTLAFHTFYPLPQAVRGGLVRVVGRVSVPAAFVAFPTLRTGVVDPTTGRIGRWWLNDGIREWSTETLTEDERCLSLRHIISHPVLVDRVREDWRPQQWPAAGQGPSPAQAVGRTVRFFAVAPDAETAERVAARLSQRGLRVDRRRDQERWSITASGEFEQATFRRLEAKVERAVRRAGGAYDGNEVQV